MKQDILNEINKGLKTYRIFEHLDEVSKELIGADREIKEKTKIIDILKKDIEDMAGQKDTAVNALKIKKKQSDEIVSNAEKKAVAIIEDATQKAIEIISMKEKENDATLADIEKSNKELLSVRSMLSKSKKELDGIRGELADTKSKFKNMFG